MAASSLKVSNSSNVIQALGIIMHVHNLSHYTIHLSMNVTVHCVLMITKLVLSNKSIGSWETENTTGLEHNRTSSADKYTQGQISSTTLRTNSASMMQRLLSWPYKADACPVTNSHSQSPDILESSFVQ